MVKRCLKYYVIAQIINLKVALQPQQILLFSLSTKSEEIVSFLFPPLLFKWDQIVHSNQINYVIVVPTLGVPILSLSYTHTHMHTPFLFLSLSLSISLFNTHTLSHTHTHSLSYHVWFKPKTHFSFFLIFHTKKWCVTKPQPTLAKKNLNFSAPFFFPVFR